MPRDANGVYTLPPSYHVQTGDTVLPVQHNPPFEDVANALTNSIDRDGRTVMTGNLQMGEYKVTGMGDGSSPSDAATVRQVHNAAPAGLKGQFAGQTPPVGWLKRNGAVLKRATYAELFAAIGTAYNTGGEASDEFRLPDDRGLFERSWDDGAGVDDGRTFGSIQQDQNKEHTHTGTAASAGEHTHTGSVGNSSAGAFLQPGSGVYVVNGGGSWRAVNHSHSLSINSNGAHEHELVINDEGGVEVRVKNRASLAIIKY